VHHRTTLSGYILTTKACIDNRKKLLNSSISSTSSHNTVNVGPLTAEIHSEVWGSPANFNEFRVLPSLLHWRQAMEINQTLHDVWPSHGLVHRVSKKLCKICLSELLQTSINFDIFCSKMANKLKLCEVHSFSTSSNSCHHTTVLSANVPNCYTTQKVVSIILFTIASSTQLRHHVI